MAQRVEKAGRFGPFAALFAALMLVLAGSTHAVTAREPSLKDRLLGVQRWVILLNNELNSYTVARIAESSYDMAVVDDIATLAWNRGLDVRPLVEAIKRRPDGGRRLAISYLNIGQAEDYRIYFPESWKQAPPSWLIGADPEGWEGNFPVAYWHPEWQAMILARGGLVEQIASEGFDGVYLDWVAGYHDESVQARANADGVDARAEMIRLLARVAAKAREINPQFLLIPQNFSDLTEVAEIYSIIDGISQEAIWFDGTVGDNPPGDCPLPRTEAEVGTNAYFATLPNACREAYNDGRADILNYAQEEYVVPRLSLARERGLAVFHIEYALQPQNVSEVVRRSHALGFHPFLAARSLADLPQPAF
jgi:cysteinyl-tRNA synthetase